MPSAASTERKDSMIVIVGLIIVGAIFILPAVFFYSLVVVGARSDIR